MQTLLADCYDRATAQDGAGPDRPQAALRQALSCYYSGNFVTGFKHGYVNRGRTGRAATAHTGSHIHVPVPVRHRQGDTMNRHALLSPHRPARGRSAHRCNRGWSARRASTRSTPRSPTSTRSW